MHKHQPNIKWSNSGVGSRYGGGNEKWLSSKLEAVTRLWERAIHYGAAEGLGISAPPPNKKDIFMEPSKEGNPNYSTELRPALFLHSYHHTQPRHLKAI
jgi:hypothetical protein